MIPAGGARLRRETGQILKTPVVKRQPFAQPEDVAGADQFVARHGGIQLRRTSDRTAGRKEKYGGPGGSTGADQFDFGPGGEVETHRGADRVAEVDFKDGTGVEGDGVGGHGGRNGHVRDAGSRSPEGPKPDIKFGAGGHTLRGAGHGRGAIDQGRRFHDGHRAVIGCVENGRSHVERHVGGEGNGFESNRHVRGDIHRADGLPEGMEGRAASHAQGVEVGVINPTGLDDRVVARRGGRGPPRRHAAIPSFAGDRVGTEIGEIAIGQTHGWRIGHG